MVKNTSGKLVNTDSLKITAAVVNSTPELASVVPVMKTALDGLADTQKSTPAELQKAVNTIGSAIMAFPDRYNAFISTINRIAFTTVTALLYENPFAFMKKGLLEYGETVQEIFVGLINALEYAPAQAASIELSYKKPNVMETFHTVNFYKHYDVSVSYVELQRAFVTYDGVGSMVDNIIRTMYTSAERDEFLMTKYLVARAVLDHKVGTVEVTGNQTDYTRTIKEYANNLTFIDSAYNAAGVDSVTPFDRQYLMTTSKFNAAMNVDVLAAAFNMEKVEFAGHVILTNRFSFTARELAVLDGLLSVSHDFNGYRIDNPYYKKITPEENAALDEIVAVHMDERFLQIYDVFRETMDTKVSAGAFWNYFYHVWSVWSTSPFVNVVAYTTNSNVTNVTVNGDASITLGESKQYTATVTGDGVYSDKVEWSVEGAGAANVTIDSSGKLIQNTKDSNSSIDVKATSIQNPAISGTKEVTIETE